MIPDWQLNGSSKPPSSPLGPFPIYHSLYVPSLQKYPDVCVPGTSYRSIRTGGASAEQDGRAQLGKRAPKSCPTRQLGEDRVLRRFVNALLPTVWDLGDSGRLREGLAC